MSTAAPRRPLDSAVIVARDRENVIVGNEIVRHRRSSRLIHWTVALTFFICVVTGMPIWTPLFGWMAHLVGGLSVARVIHPWAGIAFSLASIVMFVHWLSDMHFLPSERGWLGPKAFEYMRYESDDSEVGKYNGGQKLLFWAVALGMIGLLLSGLLMWFPRSFPPLLLELAFILHDVTFICFMVAIVFHVYLGTVAEPGTFGSMIRGTVTRQWARLHHPRWFREVTGEDPRRR
jgi:formate dehydrogenase subunit gamma